MNWSFLVLLRVADEEKTILLDSRPIWSSREGVSTPLSGSWATLLVATHWQHIWLKENMIRPIWSSRILDTHIQSSWLKILSINLRYSSVELFLQLDKIKYFCTFGLTGKKNYVCHCLWIINLSKKEDLRCPIGWWKDTSISFDNQRYHQTYTRFRSQYSMGPYGAHHTSEIDSTGHMTRVYLHPMVILLKFPAGPYGAHRF